MILKNSEGLEQKGMGILMNDKRGLLERWKTDPSEANLVTLELGCGSNKIDESSIGIDLLDAECVDIVGDVTSVLKLIPDNSIASIKSQHFMEHVDDLAGLIEECARVLVVDGTMEVSVPHFSNPFFYSDPTHKTFFGLYTFSYLVQRDSVLNRKTPSYAYSIPLNISKISMIFKSYPPMYLRHAFKKVIEKLVNISSYTKELYEESFTSIVPCYELHFVLKKI